MKKLTEKVIEAGIIPEQTVKLMKLWGMDQQLDMTESDHEQKRQLTQEQLLRMVEEIGELLEVKAEAPELRETELTLDKLFTFHAQQCTVQIIKPDASIVEGDALVARDRAGRFVFSRKHSTPAIPKPGNRIFWGEEVYEIFDVETRFEADKPSYDVCSAKEVPDAAV